ncbi:MAG: hypothetical protein JJU03_07810 [Idiomarina sp.]|nr:hypothetical protein [Idiomarina sp.]
MQRMTSHKLFFGSLLLILLAGCSSQLRTENDTQRELVEHAKYIERTAARAEALWPDFWHSSTLFIVYVQQGPALLVSQVTPVGDYEQLSETYFYFERGLPRLSGSFNIDYQVGDIVSTAVSLRETPQDTLSLLFHEAFHGYQRHHFNSAAIDEFVHEDAFKDPQVRALLQLRRLLLQNSLKAPAQQLSHLVDDLLTIDHLLVLLMGADPVERMHYFELREGTAEYVEHAANRLTSPSYNIEGAVSQRLEVLPQGVHHNTELRIYSYGTGAAQVLIAKRMVQSAEQQINAAPSLHALFTQWRGYAEPSDDTINGLLSRYPFETTLEWAYEHSDPEAALTLERFAVLDDATLDFSIHLKSPQAADALDLNVSSGPDGFTQPQQGSILFPRPDSVSIYAAMTSLLIEGVATHLQTPIDDNRVLRVQVKVDSLPELCEQASSCQLDTLDFNWQGVQFSHESDVSVRQDGSHLYIEVVEL